MSYIFNAVSLDLIIQSNELTYDLNPTNNDDRSHVPLE